MWIFMASNLYYLFNYRNYLLKLLTLFFYGLRDKVEHSRQTHLQTCPPCWRRPMTARTCRCPCDRRSPPSGRDRQGGGRGGWAEEEEFNRQRQHGDETWDTCVITGGRGWRHSRPGPGPCSSALVSEIIGGTGLWFQRNKLSEWPEEKEEQVPTPHSRSALHDQGARLWDDVSLPTGCPTTSRKMYRSIFQPPVMSQRGEQLHFPWG